MTIKHIFLILVVALIIIFGTGLGVCNFLFSNISPAKASQFNAQAHAGQLNSSSASNQNLLKNPGFESGAFAPGWEYYGDDSGASSAIDSTIAHSGRYSAKVVFDGMADVNYCRVTQRVTLTPKATYCLSGYIKTTALTTDSGALLEVQDARSWTFFALGTQMITGTQDWTYVECTFITPSDTTEIKVFLRRIAWAGPVSGTMWFDDIALTPIPSIQTLSPGFGQPGTTVTIQGANFGPDPGPGQRATETTHVSFGGVILPKDNILSWSDTAITIIIPSSPTGGAISVTVQGESSNVIFFVVPVFKAVFDSGLQFTMNNAGQWQIADASGAAAYYGGGRITYLDTTTGIQVDTTSVLVQSVITNTAATTVTLQYPPYFAQTTVVRVADGGVQISYEVNVVPGNSNIKLFTFNPYDGIPRGDLHVPGWAIRILAGWPYTVTYPFDGGSIAPAAASLTPHRGVYLLTGNHSVSQPLLFQEKTFALPLVAHRPAVEYQATDPSRPDYSLTGPYIPVDRLEGDYYLYAALEPVSFERYYRWFSHIEDFPPRVLLFTPASAAFQYGYLEASVQALEDEYRAVGFLPDVALQPFTVKPGTGRQFDATGPHPVTGWTPQDLAGYDPGPPYTVTIKNRDGTDRHSDTGWRPEFDATLAINPSHPGFVTYYWENFIAPRLSRRKFFWTDGGNPTPDYEASIRDLPQHSVLDGLLQFFAQAHAQGYAQLNNLSNFTLHAFKYLDLIDAEASTTAIIVNAEYWTPHYLAHKYWSGERGEWSKYRQQSFQEAAFALRAMDNAPRRFIMREFVGYRQSDANYALALAVARQTNQLLSVTKNGENVSTPGYDEYEIARWMLNQQYAPRIESDDFLVDNAIRTLPFGHSITIEVESAVTITTDATHWQLDAGPQQTVVNSTIAFTTTPGLHHLQVWQAHQGEVLHLERLSPEFHFVLGKPHTDSQGNAVGYRLEAIKGDWERDANPTFPQVRTSVDQPALTGNTRAGARGVRLYEGRYTDAKLLGETTADEAGEWSFTLPTPLSSGDHFITAVTLDADGQEPLIAEATSITVTVDSTAPALTTIRLPVHRWRITDRTRLVYDWSDSLSALTIQTTLGQEKITDTVEFYWDEVLHGPPSTDSVAAIDFRFDPTTNVGTYRVNAPITRVRIKGSRPIYDVYLPLVLKGFPPPAILFDETHEERNTLSEERARQLNPEHPEWHYFDEFKERVSKEYRLYRHDAGDLTDQYLQGYAILILAAPDKGLSDAEIASVVRFVQGGGGLLVLGDAGLNEGINCLLDHFDIEFDPTPIASPEHDWDAQSFYVETFAPHPVTEGLEWWHTNWGGSLQVSEPALSLSWTTPDAWKDANGNGVQDHGEAVDSFTLVAAAQVGQGRVVVVSDNAFHDMFKSFNAPLMMNMLAWLSQKNR